MLIKKEHLAGIKSRQISLAFRRWKNPAVKKGTLLKTPIGLIEIVDIKIVSPDIITNEEAVLAGYSDRDQLLESLQRFNSGNIYIIQMRYHSEDTRIALRNQPLTDEKYQELLKKTAGLDARSKCGTWTEMVMLAIKDNPCVKAAVIAEITGFEKEWLKINIRKLKNLGLTSSHDIGYELSPLGKAFLERRSN